MKRRYWLLVVGALLSASCSRTVALPKDPAALVRAAARSLSSQSVRVDGSVRNRGTIVVDLTGGIDFRDRTVSLRNDSTGPPSLFPPYESRVVGGWSYVQIASTVRRPKTLRPNVGWVAFRGQYLHALPIPGITMPADLVFENLAAWIAKPLIGVRFIGPRPTPRSQVQFRVPSLDSPKSTKVETLSLDTRGRIDRIELAARFRDGSQVVYTLDLTYVDSLPKVEPPPSDQVQRLAPSENLYASPPI